MERLRDVLRRRKKRTETRIKKEPVAIEGIILGNFSEGSLKR